MGLTAFNRRRREETAGQPAAPTEQPTAKPAKQPAAKPAKPTQEPKE